MSEITLTGKLSDRDSWTAERCPMARALDVVGARSAFLILREAFYGATRFEQFVQRAQISEPVVAARLRELTAADLLEKVPYQEPGARTRHEYRLTEQGNDLLPVVVALMRWGDKWGFEQSPRVELRHADCGLAVDVAIRCEGGHDVEPDELQLAAVSSRTRAA